MVVAENAVLLLAGLATGAASAGLAIAPAVLARGGGVPAAELAGLLLAILGTGLVVSGVAAWVVSRWPVLEPLRAE